MDDARQIVPVSIVYHLGQRGPIRLPAGAHLLMVPTSVDRPGGDREANQAVAVVLTPVTVAADTFVAVQCVVVVILVAPIAIPVIMLTGDRATTQPTTQPQPVIQPVPPGPVTVPVEIGWAPSGRRKGT